MTCIMCQRDKTIGTVIIGSLNGHTEDGPICRECLQGIHRGYLASSDYFSNDGGIYTIDDYLYCSTDGLTYTPSQITKRNQVT